jgi:protein involved in polysaccharide export with SLBB domain
VVALLMLLGNTVLAQAQGNPDSFADGDVLKITAYGREDLTGLYSVQPGPVLSLPLIGTIQLGNWNPRQLEMELAKTWENRLGSPMSVTVEFSQRAPFYVIGAVNAPGAYPYRGGLTVLQAVAVSGGFERLLKGNDNLRLDLIHEHERRLQAIEKLARARAREARLLAERDNKQQLTLQHPFTLIPQERLDAILAEETRLLDTRSHQYAIREHLLSDQIKLGEAEIASYQRQINDMAAQQGQISKEAARVRRLPGQQVRVFELEQRLTTLQTTRASLSASISRAKVEVETARNAIAELLETRQREISEALLETAQAISENELTVKSTQEVLGSAGEGDGDRRLVFSIMRNGKDEVKDVTATTLLRPGDLLDVSFAAVDPQTSATNP